MNELKVLILCDGTIALPGIKEFLFNNNVVAIATTRRNKEMQYVLEQLLKDTKVPLLLLDKKDHKTQLANAIKKFDVTVCLLMTFPFIMTADILQLPPRGFINFHFGLLPQYRGPQPILRHLLNNDREAGLTIHILDEGIDTGPIILQQKIPIEENDTYGILQSKLAFLGATQAANLLKILSYGTILPSVPQDETKAVYYKRVGAGDITINWTEMSAEKITRIVNACNPWNKGAGTSINNWGFGITETAITGEADGSETAAGTIICCDDKGGLVVRTMDNKKLKINIVYTNEGFFSGSRLSSFGITAGMKFG